MGTPSVVLVSALLFWMGAAAIATAAIVRELSLVRSRLRVAGGQVPHGLEVGTRAPRVLRSNDGARHVTVFLDAGCEPCYALAEDLQTLPSAAELVFAITGSEDAALELAERLPPNANFTIGSVAAAAAAAAQAHSQPSALVTEKGLVVGKIYLGHAAEIAPLLTMTRFSPE